MAGFGFGFGQRHAKVCGPSINLIDPVPLASPSMAWDGSLNSGFSSFPTDPVRTTAKPIIRLIVPPNQFYTDELLVGVMAGASNKGSLLKTLGLDKVLVHFEGNQFEIKAPSFHTLRDANGIDRAYLGWWVLLRHDGRHGHGNVYFEAIPSDKTLQSRVIGPYQFSAQPKLHDLSVEVAPSLPKIDGVRYQSVSTALSYLADKAAQNPLVTITQAGTYDIGSSTSYAGGAGYCTIQASAPVTFAKSSYAGDTRNRLFVRYGGVRFKGANITFDMRNITSVHKQGDREIWMDGVRFTNSDPAGRGALWRGRHRPYGWLVVDYPWLTEVETEHLPNVANEANLARGCRFDNGYADVAGDTACIINCTATRWDSSQEWLRDCDALTVAYTGDLAPATLEMAGSGGASTRTITARWGQQMAQLVVGSKDTDLATGAYWVQDVVNWLNALPGWSASVLDNSRYASALGVRGGLAKAWGPLDVAGKTQTLVTTFDIHADFYQKRQGNLDENVVVAFNRSWLRGQNLFIDSSTPCFDYLVFNNVFECPEIPGDYYDELHSQFGSSRQSHVVVVHNSWQGQKVYFRTDNPGFEFDQYCVFSNNSVPNVIWTSGVDEDLILQNNHLQDGASEPLNSTGTSIGGEGGTNYLDIGGGNFAPSGVLAASLKPPVIEFDYLGRKRGPLAAAGALI